MLTLRQLHNRLVQYQTSHRLMQYQTSHSELKGDYSLKPGVLMLSWPRYGSIPENVGRHEPGICQQDASGILLHMWTAERALGSSCPVKKHDPTLCRKLSSTTNSTGRSLEI